MIDKKDLLELKQRAIKVKEPYVTIGEEARRVYAGDNRSRGRGKGEPTADWNYTYSTVQGNVARLIQGDPRPQITAKDSEMIDTAEWFNDKLSGKLYTSSIAPLLRQAVQDASLYGLGFVFINDEVDLESVNFFDVYLDNALSNPNDIFKKGRYAFVRVLEDKNDFKERYKVELKHADISEEMDGGSGKLHGRETVGSTVAPLGNMMENYTAVVPDAIGDVESDQQTNLAQDGLVEYWLCWVTDEDSESGWTLHVLFEDEIIKSVHEPSYRKHPLLFNFSSDSLSGQVYQPSDFVYTSKYERQVNWLTQKIYRAINSVSHPPLIVSKSSKPEMLGAGGVIQDMSQFADVPGQIVQVNNSADDPRWMQREPLPFQWGQQVDAMKESAFQTISPQVLQGAADTGVTSGKALRELRTQADVRMQLKVTNRDETLRDITEAMCTEIFAQELEIATLRAQTEIQNAKEKLIVATGAKIPEGMDIPFESIAPMVRAENEDQLIATLMPPELQGVSFEDIRNGLVFSWLITPPVEREDKIDQILLTVQNILPVAMGDPILAIKMAGITTGYKDVAEELIAAIEEHIQSLQVEEPIQGAGNAEPRPTE